LEEQESEQGASKAGLFIHRIRASRNLSR